MKKNGFGESCWDEKKGFLGKQHPLEQHCTANPAPQPQCCSENDSLVAESSVQEAKKHTKYLLMGAGTSVLRLRALYWF